MVKFSKSKTKEIVMGFSQEVLDRYANTNFLIALKSKVFAAEFHNRVNALHLNDEELMLLLSYINEAAMRQKRGVDWKRDKAEVGDLIDISEDDSVAKFFSRKMLKEDTAEGRLLRKLGMKRKHVYKVKAAHDLIDDLATIASNLMS